MSVVILTLWMEKQILEDSKTRKLLYFPLSKIHFTVQYVILVVRNGGFIAICLYKCDIHIAKIVA